MPRRSRFAPASRVSIDDIVLPVCGACAATGLNCRGSADCATRATMSSPAPAPTSNTPSPATARGAQVALGVFLAVLVGLLAFRGYANHLGARPTEPMKADLIVLNSADQSELAQVPGVGPKMAEAIADH